MAQCFFDLLLDFEQGSVQRGGLCGNFGEVRNMGGAAVWRECAKHRIRPVLYGDTVLHPEHIVHLVHLAPLVFVHAVNIGVHCERYRVVTENARQCFVIHLKEDLRKLDELSNQVRYMGRYGIEIEIRFIGGYKKTMQLT